MTAPDPVSAAALAKLREIPLPPAVSYVPQTVGWLVVAVVLAALVGWAWWRRHQRWVANRYRRAALADLAALEGRLSVASERRTAAAAIPALLKRTALAVVPRASVASLSDAEWLAFLDRTCPPGGFASGAGPLLARLAYADEAPVADADVRALVALARRWIAEHDARL